MAQLAVTCARQGQGERNLRRSRTAARAWERTRIRRCRLRVWRGRGRRSGIPSSGGRAYSEIKSSSWSSWAISDGSEETETDFLLARELFHVREVELRSSLAVDGWLVHRESTESRVFCRSTVESNEEARVVSRAEVVEMRVVVRSRSCMELRGRYASAVDVGAATTSRFRASDSMNIVLLLSGQIRILRMVFRRDVTSWTDHGRSLCGVDGSGGGDAGASSRELDGHIGIHRALSFAYIWVERVVGSD